jgi:hypothetical protein
MVLPPQSWRLTGDQYVEKGGKPWISEMVSRSGYTDRQHMAPVCVHAQDWCGG